MNSPTALVTGASSGIGLELARILAANGYDLVLVARREDRLNELKKTLEAAHGIVVTVLPFDLRIPTAPAKIYEAITEKNISVDILVNNAGYGVYGPYITTPWEKEFGMIAVNITAVSYLTKLFGADMVARGRGRILNLSSTAAFQPGPLMAVYYASKAYVQSFSEALSEELRGTGVTVTAYCPGPTESEFQSAAAIENSLLVKWRRAPSSAEVALDGYRAMMQGKTAAIHGKVNAAGTVLARLLPRALVVRVVRFVNANRL